MSNNIGGAGKFNEQLLATLKSIQRDASALATGSGGNGAAKTGEQTSFAEHLHSALAEVDQKQKVADRMSMELATGRAGNIHETMLATTQAELSFNLMVQIRNKALEAYGEVMKMSV